MSNQITVVMPHDKTQIQVNVSKVFETLAPVLPIVSRLFASDAKEDATINTRDLHKALGVGRNHATWWNGVVDRLRLVEGTHFVTVDEPIVLSGNKIPVHYYVSLNVAQHLSVLANTEQGYNIREYLFAVAKTFHATIESGYRKQLLAAKMENEEHHREVCTLIDENRALALKQGYKSATDFTMKNQETKALKKAQTDAADHGAVAVEFWEYSTRALKALRAKDVPKAITHLSYLTERFGEYDDLNRHEPPWQSSLWQ